MSLDNILQFLTISLNPYTLTNIKLLSLEKLHQDICKDQINEMRMEQLLFAQDIDIEKILIEAIHM